MHLESAWPGVSYRVEGSVATAPAVIARVGWRRWCCPATRPCSGGTKTPARSTTRSTSPRRAPTTTAPTPSRHAPLAPSTLSPCREVHVGVYFRDNNFPSVRGENRGLCFAPTRVYCSFLREDEYRQNTCPLEALLHGFSPCNLCAWAGVRTQPHGSSIRAGRVCGPRCRL